MIAIRLFVKKYCVNYMCCRYLRASSTKPSCQLKYISVTLFPLFHCPIIVELKFGAKFVDISWIYCYGVKTNVNWYHQPSDWGLTNTTGRVRHFSSQLRLCRGVGLEAGENRKPSLIEMIFRSRGALCLLCQFSQSSKCFGRNLSLSTEQWIAGIAGMPVNFTSYVWSHPRHPHP